RVIAPLFLPRPIRLLKLMLHEKEPHACCARDDRDGKLQEQQALPADEENERRKQNGDGEVRPVDAATLCAPRCGCRLRKALQDREVNRGGDEEEQKWIAIDAIPHAMPSAQRAIFVDGENRERAK